MNHQETPRNSIKQIYKDNDTGKIIITDYNNNKYETDIFGRKTKNFLPKITGVIPGSERRKLNLIKYNNHSVSPSNNNTIFDENEEKNHFHSKKIINYYPKINRLDGFSFFPRPISHPFYNIPDFEMKNNLKKEINKKIKEYYNNENKIKNITNNKIILSYLTNDLNEYDIRENDKEKLINLLGQNIEELKDEYKMKLNSIDKDPYYIALMQFRKKLLLSKKNQIKLNEASNEIKKQYHILFKVMNNNSSNKKQKLINKKENKYIHKYFKNRAKSKESQYKKINIFNKNYKKQNLVTGPDTLNNICRSKDFAIGRTIKMDFGSFSYEEKEKILSLEKNNNTDRPREDNDENQSINLFPKISNNMIKNSKSKDNLYNYIDKDTAETVTNMNRNNTDFNIIIDEKIGDDELSFISKENENENEKNNNKKKINIRTLKFVKYHCQHEKELLEGIKNETPRKEITINRIKTKILKNNGQLYRENMALLKLTNPKKFELMEKKDENDMKLLIKKLKNSRKKMEINKK